MRLDLLFWLALILIPGLVAFVLIKTPERIVQWQSSFYQFWYKNFLHMSDEAIDRLPRLPSDSYLTGKRSSFINEASQHPEHYAGLLRVYRTVGCLIAAMILLGISLMVWGALTGRLIIKG